MLLKLNVWQIFCPKVHRSWSAFVFSPSVMFCCHFETEQLKHKRLWNLSSSVYQWIFDLLSYDVVFSYIEDFYPDTQPNKNNFQKKK